MDLLFLDPQLIDLTDKILFDKIVCVPLHQVLHFLQLKSHLLVILHNGNGQKGLPVIIPVPVLLTYYVRRNNSDLVIKAKGLF